MTQTFDFKSKTLSLPKINSSSIMSWWMLRRSRLWRNISQSTSIPALNRMMRNFKPLRAISNHCRIESSSYNRYRARLNIWNLRNKLSCKMLWGWQKISVLQGLMWLEILMHLTHKYARKCRQIRLKNRPIHPTISLPNLNYAKSQINS